MSEKTLGKRIRKRIAAAAAAAMILAALSAFQSAPNQDITMPVEKNNTENIETGNAEQAETTKIRMLFGDVEIDAVLDNSETSRAFTELLPLTLDMRRYADREYYAAIDQLPETGETIPDYENGDVTYYAAGRSLAIFFGNADKFTQDGLIRMGTVISDLSLFDQMNDSVTVTIEIDESEELVRTYDFSEFTNIEITGIDPESLTDEELAILYTQARYCQAMTDADIDTMRKLVSEDMIYTHMSGMRQTREEYFADVANGRLKYFTIGIENPVIKVDGSKAQITYTSILNANAYGARGTYRMSGTHAYEKRDGTWIAVNR